MKTTITIEISPAEKISEPRAFGMPPVEYYEVKATATYKEPVEVSVEYPGKSVEVPLHALFNDVILSVTEATKVAAEGSVAYRGGELAKTATVVVYDRNALTWTDDRIAAAFVSSKDPWVLDLSGNILAAAKLTLAILKGLELEADQNAPQHG